MDQLYEQWLQSQKPGWGEETSNSSVRENGKQIHMPTDYAEEVVRYESLANTHTAQWFDVVTNTRFIEQLGPDKEIRFGESSCDLVARYLFLSV